MGQSHGTSRPRRQAPWPGLGGGKGAWWQEDDKDSSPGGGRGRELEMPGRGSRGASSGARGPGCESPALPQSPCSCLGLFPPCKLAVHSHPPLRDL